MQAERLAIETDYRSNNRAQEIWSHKGRMTFLVIAVVSRDEEKAGQFFHVKCFHTR